MPIDTVEAKIPGALSISTATATAGQIQGATASGQPEARCAAGLDMPAAISALDRIALTSWAGTANNFEPDAQAEQMAATEVRQIVLAMRDPNDRSGDLSRTATILRQKYVQASNFNPKEEGFFNRFNPFKTDKSSHKSPKPSAPAIDRTPYHNMCNLLRGAELKELAQVKLEKEMVRHAAFSNFPASDTWRLLMDMDRQGPNGDYVFEDESGYMAGAMNGFRKMLQTVQAPLTADLLEDLHDTCVDQVWGQTSSVYFRLINGRGTNHPIALKKGYRDGNNNKFSLSTDWNATPEGLKELMDLARGGSNITLENDSGDTVVGARMSLQAAKRNPDTSVVALASKEITELYLATERKSRIQCQQLAKDIIGRYQDEIKNARNAGEKREAIARCCRDLEVSHLFSDGNARTIGFLLVNKLLLQNGLGPTLMRNPNLFDGYSVKELAAEIEAGQLRLNSMRV